jgi:hypothetical protein
MTTRTRWAVAIGSLGVAVIAAGLYLTLRDNARPVTVDEARSRTTSTAAGDDTGDAGGVDGPARPAAGVYLYEGSGSESLSTPPLSQSQGPEMPATVEHHDGGCWSLRIDLSSNHWQRWDYCPDGADLVEMGGESWQRWMIGTTAITNLSTFECDEGSVVLPARRAPDQSWDARCTGTNEAVEGTTVSQGPYRFIGDELVEVDGRDVPSLHFAQERTMSGSQRGQERAEVWLDAETGLLLRLEREVDVRSDTPIGESTYTESASFRLISLDPQ